MTLVLEATRSMNEIAPSKIVIEFSPRLESSIEGEKFRLLLEGVKTFADELCEDLGLPPEVIVELKTLSEIEPNDFAVSINGQKCAAQVPATLNPTASPRELVRAMAEVVCENREALLTQSFSDELRMKWCSGFVPVSLSSSYFREVLVTMIHRHFSINRLKEQFSEVTSGTRALPEILEDVCDPTSLKVFLSKEQAKNLQTNSDKVEERKDGESLPDTLPESNALMIDGLFYELGLLLPNISIANDDLLETNEFQIQINDVRLPPGAGLLANQAAVNESVDRLSMIGVTGERVSSLLSNTECAIVTGDEALAACQSAKLITSGPAAFITLNLWSKIKSNAGSLLNARLVEFMLNKLRQSYPALIGRVSSSFDSTALAAIFRNLLDEEIGIRDCRTILEGLLALNHNTTEDLSKLIVFYPYAVNVCHLKRNSPVAAPDPVAYANSVRIFLKKYISHKYTRGSGTLQVYLVDPEIENRLSGDGEESLSADEREKLISAISRETQNVPSTGAVIITGMESRGILRRLISRSFPYLPVLAYQELSPDLNLQPLARISWN